MKAKRVTGFVLAVVIMTIALSNHSIAQIRLQAESIHNPERTALTAFNLSNKMGFKSDILAAQPMIQPKNIARNTIERPATQHTEKEAIRKAAETSRRQSAAAPIHDERCRGSLVMSGVRSTKYFDAYEGDYASWIEFYNAARLEGTGVGRNGRYYRYDSITTNKTASPSYTREQLGESIAGGDGWPYVQHTMAADLNVNPLGTRYYLDWGEGNPWNGIYVVEDTGEGLHGWHLDIYTGFGISDMATSPVDLHANVYATTC